MDDIVNDRDDQEEVPEPEKGPYQIAFEENRLGRILISKQIYQDFADGAKMVMDMILPTRIEHLFHYDAFEIIGYSPAFDALQEWHAPVDYEAVVQKIDGVGSFKEFRKKYETSIPQK